MFTRRSVLSLAAAGAFPPQALLNHFYATVDSTTYRAIEESSFLRQQFAPFEKRTTVRNDSTYSGLYFYGDQTYFEFFEENQGDRKPGDAGLALGLEQAGASESLRNRWQAIRPSVTTMVTRQLDGQPIDWFRMTSFEETRAQSAVEGLRLFSMEYAPGFAERWHASSGASIAQRTILAAYCAKLQMSQLRETSLIENVRQVEIAAPEAGVRLRASQLESAGWKLKPTRESIRCTGPNASVLFRFAAKPEGVYRVEFALKRAFPRVTQQIGGTTLEFTGARRAIWQLRP